jgi:hypothetical protein
MMSGDNRYFVLLNGKRIESPAPTITGIQLRLLAQVPAGHPLILESSGEKPDRLLADTDALDLTDSCPSVFSKPPTVFGSMPHERA